MTKKITELNEATILSGEDLLVCVENPSDSSTIETKKITVNNFFGSLGVTATPSTLVTSDVVGNNLVITLSETPEFKRVKFSEQLTPANSTYANSTYTFSTGDMFYDTDYIYIAVSNTELKRVSLTAY